MYSSVQRRIVQRFEPNHPQHILPISLELFQADAADALQRVQAGGGLAGNGRQRGVMKNHIGRQVVLARDLSTPSFEGGQALLGWGIELGVGFVGRGVARAQAFDFYVFALSWSPGFCAVEGQEKGREQCAVGARTGFVVHGLWPQNETASAIDCPAGQSPIPRPALEDARDLFPSEGLARYQWRKHGGCTGLAPSVWLNDVRRARGAIMVPPVFANLQSELRVEPEDVARPQRRPFCCSFDRTIKPPLAVLNHINGVRY